MAKIITVEQAVDLIPDGATIMIGNFVGCGNPHKLLKALAESGKGGFHAIHNDSSMVATAARGTPDGSDAYGLAALLRSGQIVHYTGSHLGTNAEATALWREGKLGVDLVPQGSFAEMIRAGGAGLGGVLTPTGVGTEVEQSPLVDRKLNVDGKDYLLMKPLHADVALLQGYKVDKAGNIWYKGTQRNFAPLMAMAADVVFVEAENLVEIGEIEPENVHTPGILVKYIVVEEGK